MISHVFDIFGLYICSIVGNFCFGFQFACVNFGANSVSDTHILKTIFKGYGKWRDVFFFFNKFLRKLGSYIFENLGIVWEVNCLQFDIKKSPKLFVNPFGVFFKKKVKAFI